MYVLCQPIDLLFCCINMCNNPRETLLFALKTVDRLQKIVKIDKKRNLIFRIDKNFHLY